MDNGHHNAIFSVNPDVDDNLNEENWQRSLEISAPAGMPTPEQLMTPEQMASQEIASTEDAGLYSAENSLTPDNQTYTAQENQAIKTPENSQEMGQIIPINSAAPNVSSPESYQQNNITSIEINGDQMSKSGIEKVDNAIGKLGQDHQLSPFYDEIRGPLSKEAQDAVGHINIDDQREAV